MLFSDARQLSNGTVNIEDVYQSAGISNWNFGLWRHASRAGCWNGESKCGLRGRVCLTCRASSAPENGTRCAQKILERYVGQEQDTCTTARTMAPAAEDGINTAAAAQQLGSMSIGESVERKGEPETKNQDDTNGGTPTNVAAAPRVKFQESPPFFQIPLIE